jgi:Mn2+/Fe2+ NRAMP family transporter
MTGQAALPAVSRSAITGIMATAIMRVALFLAALGVVSQGLQLDAANPPASIFQHAAGQLGFRLFGLVMWSAAVTSVVGASYTSVSFIRTWHPRIATAERFVIIGFISLATLLFLWIGRPVKTLIAVGALNGMILPLALASILLAAHKHRIVGSYRHPVWLTVFGVAVVIIMTALSLYTIVTTLRTGL